jgi:hypothetical protein
MAFSFGGPAGADQSDPVVGDLKMRDEQNLPVLRVPDGDEPAFCDGVCWVWPGRGERVQEDACGFDERDAVLLEVGRGLGVAFYRWSERRLTVYEFSGNTGANAPQPGRHDAGSRGGSGSSRHRKRRTPTKSGSWETGAMSG